MHRFVLPIALSLSMLACGDDGSSPIEPATTAASEGTGVATQGTGPADTGSTAAASDDWGAATLLTTGADTTSATGEGDETGEPPANQVPCDVLTVTCDQAPPACDGLNAPEIVDGCYTRACIPLSSCEEVADFSCDECEAAEVCVRFSSCGGDACTFVSACLPDPGAAVVNCATAGDVLCGAFGPGFACHDEATGPYCCTGDAGACANAG